MIETVPMKHAGISKSTIGSLSIGPSEGFIETPSAARIIDRAMSYLEADIPVHLTGPTGTGKSTLAMHLAYKLNQS
jgi:nitric oxide reductase NorQ protein